MTRWDRLDQQAANIQDRKRQLILLQALVLFCCHGVQKTTLSDVAKDLGISKTALYRYFASKEDLICACHNEIVAMALDALGTRSQEGETGFQALTNCLDRLFHEIIPLIGAPIFVVRSGDVGARAFQDIQRQKGALETRLRVLIEMGMSDGSIIPVDSLSAVRSLLGSLETATQWCREDPTADPASLTKSIITLALRALATNPPTMAVQNRATEIAVHQLR